MVMIVIDDDFGVDADAYNWILYERRYLQRRHFFPTFKLMARHLIDHKAKASIADSKKSSRNVNMELLEHKIESALVEYLELITEKIKEKKNGHIS